MTHKKLVAAYRCC